MKTRRLFSTLFTVFLFVLSGCTFGISDKSNPPVSEGKVLLSIRLHDSYSRTAIPTINWEEFTYELIALQNPGTASQKKLTLFNSREEEELISGVTLDAGNYKFTLNAFKNGKKVLSGEETVDLTSGNASLVFKMYTVSGGTGNASVKIIYPKINPVAKIEAYVSTDIFAEETGITLTSKIVSGKYETVFEPKNLPSDTEQYAIFRFYDENGTLVYFGAESLIIVGECTSKSEIELTDEDWHTYACTVTLKKDNEGWTSSGKTVSLVNKSDSGKVYNLADSAGGKFKASVAEGLYYVYVNGENTGVDFNSKNKNIDVNYYTVSMTPVKSSIMVPVSGGIDMSENTAVVQSGKAFTYKLVLSKGYEVNSLVVKQNGTAVAGAEFNQPIVIDSVTQSIKISAEGITPIVYHISYSDGENGFQSTKHTSLAYWYDYDNTDNVYTPPVEFTVEEVIILPAIQNVRKANNYFDAWTDAKGNIVISTEEIYEDLVLTANWRPAPKVDDQNKVIYANGFNLLIKGSDTKNSATYIYVDYNGDGIKNQDDYQITCKNITTTKNNDFTGYDLRAGSDDGSYVPKSDFTFTMTGGKIAAIYGLNSADKKYSNKSTLKISGTAQIGNIEDQVTVTNPDSTTTTTAASVKGIMLDTLSSERVFIVAQMSNLTDSTKSPYSVTCVTSKNFDRKEEHVVAEIVNSNYASLANFTCWNIAYDEKEPSKKNYTQIVLTNKEVLLNSIEKTYIQMADNSGVVLPTDGEIAWDTVKNEFSFAVDSVNKPCSVFSLAVENGTFRVNERTTITNNRTDSDQIVEGTLTYMAQPTPLTYVEELDFDENYVYMQVFSSGDLLTPLVINDFLSQICFKKIDEEKKIKVTLNIETVPSKYIRGNGDGKGGSEYKYFNGSFYKRFHYDNDTSTGYSVYNDTGRKRINWTNAYNKAKAASPFNGLTGYLMNITSEVENNYIYDTFYKLSPDELSWAGGAAFVPVATIEDPVTGQNINRFDQRVTSSSTAATTEGSRNLSSKWYWQAGPEAGQCFYNVAVSANKNVESELVDGMFERWNNYALHGEVYCDDLNCTEPGKLVKGRTTTAVEPNGSKTATVNGVSINTTSEPCLEFLAGKLESGSVYTANGFWNNYSDQATNDAYGCSGYIVEYTPYETVYGKQVANYQAIKRSAEY